jgi:hypothetical protein
MYENKPHRPEAGYWSASRKVVNRRNWVKHFIAKGHTRAVAIKMAKEATKA